MQAFPRRRFNQPPLKLCRPTHLQWPQPVYFPPIFISWLSLFAIFDVNLPLRISKVKDRPPKPFYYILCLPYKTNTSFVYFVIIRELLSQIVILSG